MGKDEMDFTLLPPDSDTRSERTIYGGDHRLAYREAINWVDASARRLPGLGVHGCFGQTVHLFRDETPEPGGVSGFATCFALHSQEPGVESALLVHAKRKSSLPDGFNAPRRRLAAALP